MRASRNFVSRSFVSILVASSESSFFSSLLILILPRGSPEILDAWYCLARPGYVPNRSTSVSWTLCPRYNLFGIHASSVVPFAGSAGTQGERYRVWNREIFGISCGEPSLSRFARSRGSVTFGFVNRRVCLIGNDTRQTEDFQLPRVFVWEIC